MTKKATIELDQAGYRILSIIHDEINISLPKTEHLETHISKIEKIMTSVYPLNLPISVDITAKEHWS